jgi:gluconolactonase
MSHTSLRPEFEELVELDAPPVQVATDFMFTEGPVWHPVEQFLLFSDMPGDVRRRWDRHHGVVEVKRPANKCNGMTYDADLNLIVCEHATSLLVREKPDGTRQVLASHFEGKELNSPNDVCVRSDGSIYFSDPYYGRVPVFGVERPRELGFQGVHRVPPDGVGLQLLVDRDLFEQPNGLCLSHDEKLLYVNDRTDPRIQRRFRRLVVGRASVRKRNPVVVTERRSGRHEMRRARQCLGHGPGGRVGLCPVRRVDRQVAHSGGSGQSRLGRP